MSSELFKGLDALVKRSTAQKPLYKSNKKTNKETKKSEGPIKKNPLHEVQIAEMKHDLTTKPRQSARNTPTILAKLSTADPYASTGMLSTNDSYNGSKLMYSRASKPHLVDEKIKETSDKNPTSQNESEEAGQSRSTTVSLQYALTIDDVETKMAYDTSRSQASQVLRAKIEMSNSNLDEIWNEPPQFSTSQQFSHASTSNFMTNKTKISAGKHIIESTNL